MKIGGEEILAAPRSREATVYLTQKYAYKILGNSNPYDLLFEYKEAERLGVPVGDVCMFTAELQSHPQGQSQYVSGIRTTLGTGLFFQLSKKGSEGKFENVILATSNIRVLEKILEGLVNAGEAGITDPQGFIDPFAEQPLKFIDIHRRHLSTRLFFDNLINKVQIRIDELKNAA